MIVWGQNQIELLPKLEFDLARGNHDTGHDWHYDHQNYNSVMITMMKMMTIARQKVHNGIVLTAASQKIPEISSKAYCSAPPPLQQNCQKDDDDGDDVDNR